MKSAATYLFILVLLLFSCNENKNGQDEFTIENCEDQDVSVIESISFLSLDSLLITAELYCNNKDAEVLVLCHQARFSRGEYKETAKKFYDMGFNCLLIDQRSGGEVKQVKNITAKRAKSKGLPVEYLDAEQDIIAAVNFAVEFYGKEVILLGSSYSASLALKIAAENKYVEKVIAFSPGEYFGEELNLKESIAELEKPVFITSSKQEADDAAEIFDAIPSTTKTQFIPKGEGEHGSKALWSEKQDHQEYWDALMQFLGK